MPEVSIQFSLFYDMVYIVLPNVDPCKKFSLFPHQFHLIRSGGQGISPCKTDVFQEVKPVLGGDTAPLMEIPICNQYHCPFTSC